MPSIIAGSLMRATPPSRRMSAGTRSSAITATAPASSATLACSGVTTSMITPPRSISARPRLTRAVPVVGSLMRRAYRLASCLLPRVAARDDGSLLLLGGRGRRRRRRRGDRRRGGRRRRLDHVDRRVVREQLDPRLARAQQDRLTVGVDVLGGLRLVGTHPRALAEH